MHCPTCHAKLLSVQGELFCLQCGRIVSPHEAEGAAGKPAEPVPQEILQRAVRDLRPNATFARPAVTSAPASDPVLSAAHVPVAAVHSTGWHRRSLPRGAVIALMVLAIFGIADALTSWYYHDRVYPGVKVTDQSLGGQPLAGVASKLQQVLAQEPVHFTIGTTDYTMTPAELGVSVDTAQLARAVQAQGRSQGLALVGIGQTIISTPLGLEYRVQDQLLTAVAARLAAQNSHPATEAQPIIVGTTPLVLAEKAGQQVDPDKLRESLLIAVRRHQHVTVSPTRLGPALASTAYAADIEDARVKIGLSLSIKIKTRTITPPPAEIASWLTFGEPGSGAHVDAGRIGGYLAAVSGTFDRAATQTALVAALGAKQALSYAAPVKKSTQPTSVGPAAPSAATTYSYCVASRGADDTQLATLATQAAEVLSRSQGWSLGGRLKWVPVASGCNVTLWLVANQDMTAFSTACSHQATCRTGNDIVLNVSRWQAPAAAWTDSLAAYRTELINHEFGHWLGFDHASCAPNAPADSPVSQTTVTVAGCAPAWHPVPAELQGLKILPGF